MNIILCLAALLLLMSPCSAKEALTVVKISPQATHSISPYIYGFGTYLKEDRTLEKVWDLRPTLYRWGGNTSTRYNYKTNSWNAAADWYFRNYGGKGANMIDSFMAENVRHGVASAITLPMLGWVAKDDSSASYPRALFPKQDSFDGDAGNGALNGKSLPADPNRSSVAIDPKFLAGWVAKLKTQFGPHPHFYIMDNEPMIWHSTHRDVLPIPMTYDGYLAKYIAFASAVRAEDPKAVIVGPAEWGWMGMMYSGFDVEGPWNGYKKQVDRKKHGDQPFLEWFLENLAAEEKHRKVSLLDVLDVHFYPETGGWPKGEDSSSGVRKALLNSTKSLWDRNYTDDSWISEKIYFIPRLKEMARKFKPTAKVSIGEYNFRAEKDVSGAIAQAEALGVFAEQDLYAAQLWDFPKRESSQAYAFQLFRDFDGKGSAFGSQSVPNSAGVQDDYSVFTARDVDRLTVVILNKNLKAPRAFELDLKGWPEIGSARLVRYEAEGSEKAFKMHRIEKSLSASGTAQTFKIPSESLSMQIIEFKLKK